MLSKKADLQIQRKEQDGYPLTVDAVFLGVNEIMKNRSKKRGLKFL